MHYFTYSALFIGTVCPCKYSITYIIIFFKQKGKNRENKNEAMAYK